MKRIAWPVSMHSTAAISAGPALDQVGDRPAGSSDAARPDRPTQSPNASPRRPTRRIDVGDIAGSHHTQQRTVDR